ncbi:MAG: DUF4328 domain-containing protein [Chloroflexi bacterium]|nr:DUF4328 domain-containing protein [Chloroflexota bacterium]MBT4142586.1 DUF4328 domain-containing protein [Chloroflexota bacterium]MBT4341642.1 DUF4328 domain-containing protein [Chloroflexota bacterium]MBT5253634.1 DUF4328 domain-containing protein [Chloroflexota bacterium]MBT5893733.1 DUF4328 domain-containing protein [Chloroflexota bacterium]
MQPGDPKGKYDPRPPKDRRVAGEDTADSGKARRLTRSSSRPVAGGGGVMGRITGRNEMDRAKAKRYEPYSYESNSTQIRWVVVALTAWVVVALVLAWQDRATASYLGDLQNQGIASVPPTQQSTLRDVDKILEFAAIEGVDCTTQEQIIALTPECSSLMDVQDKYTSVKDTGAMLFVLLMAVFLANMFAFGAFTHRSSRNLLTLKSDKQGFSPEKSVMWFFVPVLNLIKPWQVFRELFRGSDPDVTTSNQVEWKTKGKVPVIVNVWAAIFVAVFLFNPRTIGMYWYSVRETLDDVVIAHQRLVIADLLLAVLGVAAIFVALELHKRQEACHAKVGDITVTPPAPVDPLEEALKEGIRRKDLENERSRSKRRGSGK